MDAYRCEDPGCMKLFASRGALSTHQVRHRCACISPKRLRLTSTSDLCTGVAQAQQQGKAHAQG